MYSCPSDWKIGEHQRWEVVFASVAGVVVAFGGAAAVAAQIQIEKVAKSQNPRPGPT